MWLPKRYLKSFRNSKIKLFSPLVGFLVRCLVHYFWGSDTYFVAVIFLFISSYNHMLYLKLYSKYSFCVTKWCWNDALTSIINFYWEGSYPPLWDVSLPWILAPLPPLPPIETLRRRAQLILRNQERFFSINFLPKLYIRTLKPSRHTNKSKTWNIMLYLRNGSPLTHKLMIPIWMKVLLMGSSVSSVSAFIRT